MKGYSFLVNKQFKVNKKRSIFTIIGIVLGIILFTSVGYINSFMEEVKIAEAKARYGDYSAVFFNVNKENIESLRKNVKVESCGLYQIEKYENIRINEISKDMEVYALDDISMEVLFKPTIEITEGVLPEKKKEIALTMLAKGDLNKKVGDEIILGENSYSIVGFYNDRENNPFMLSGITKLKEEIPNSQINVVINVKGKEDIEEIILDIAKGLGINTEDETRYRAIKYNNILLQAYEDSSVEYMNNISEEKVTLWFINGTILMLTSILTYGSINVSMKERIKYFSTLRCIGATPDKIRYLLIKEGFLLGGLSIIPGLIIGHGVSWIIIRGVFEKIIKMNLYGVGFNLYWKVVILSVFLTVVIIFVSAFIPVMRVGKISPVVGAKTGGILMKNSKHRKSKTIRRLFGYEGELAYKNIRGDNRSFIITTIVLVSLLIVFVGFTGFYMGMKQVYKKENNNMEVDFSINYYTTKRGEEVNNENAIERELINIDNHIEFLESTEAVEKVMSKVNINITPMVGGVKSRNVLSGEKTAEFRGEKYTFIEHGGIYLYDDEALKSILPYINGDTADLEDFRKNGMVIVNTNVRAKDFTRRSEEIFQVNFGEKLQLYLVDKNLQQPLQDNLSEENLKNLIIDSNLIEATVLGTIDSRNTLDGKDIENSKGIYIIASKNFYENNKDVFENKGYENNMVNIDFNFIDSNKKKQHLEEIKNYTNKISGWYIDKEVETEEQIRSLTGMMILIYTVLFFAMTIGVLNIVNNKYINIHLRKKELGVMLSIGITRKKLRKIILLEGVIQWFISSLIGGTISYIFLKALYIYYVYFGSIEEANPPILVIVLGVLLLLIINLISSVIPLRRLKTIELTEFIREEE